MSKLTLATVQLVFEGEINIDDVRAYVYGYGPGTKHPVVVRFEQLEELGEAHPAARQLADIERTGKQIEAGIEMIMNAVNKP